MYKDIRYSVHSIIDKNTLGFSAIEYSKFKFGDQCIADKFADELLEYFLNSELFISVLEIRSLIIYSSPYAYLPTSSLLMTRTFYRKLKLFLEMNFDFEVKITLSKINRKHSYTEDYGAMSAEERFDLIKNDTYQIELSPEENALLLFLDDISITGTHQLIVENILKSEKIINKRYFLYYAKLDNIEIKPSFENELNYSFVQNEIKLADILITDCFVNTTRTTKYILGLSTPKLLNIIKLLQEAQKTHVLQQCLEGAIKNEYHKIEAYKSVIQVLIDHVNLSCDTLN